LSGATLAAVSTPSNMMDLTLTPFTVAGTINSGAFQKAKAIAQKCDAAASATILELLPVEYHKLLGSLAQEYGGPAYMHEAGVAVYSEQAGWIGDDAQLIKWLGRNKVGGIANATNSNGKAVNWDFMAQKAYQELLSGSERSFAYLEVAVESEGSLGKLVFELYPSLAPATCANFLSLCGAESGGYVNSSVHRIKPGAWLQAGDNVTGNGDAGASAAGSFVPDESFHVKHNEYGVLGMANQGEAHTAMSQFYVTFAATPYFDKKYVAFGKLVDGLKLLKYLEIMDCANERPRANLFIASAGKVLPVEGTGSALYETEDEAAAKVQAMHKARLHRKELQEKKAAAAKVQAAKRGQAARKQAKEEKEAAVKVQAISRGRKARSKK